MNNSDVAAFEAELTAEGFEVSSKSLDASMVVEDHTHDFNVRGLVTAGAFDITVDGRTTHYGVGKQFTMAAGCVHAEAIGPEGVSFTVGRRDS
jgi:quercetin dioxygenase-like cupin family protein